MNADGRKPPYRPDTGDTDKFLLLCLEFSAGFIMRLLLLSLIGPALNDTEHNGSQ